MVLQRALFKPYYYTEYAGTVLTLVRRRNLYWTLDFRRIIIALIIRFHTPKIQTGIIEPRRHRHSQENKINYFRRVFKTV